MKSYTNLEQSKKLAEILPRKSADMYWMHVENKELEKDFWKVETIQLTWKPFSMHIPCWSLAALLAILDYPQLSKDKLGSGKEGWMVSVYPDNCRFDSCWHDNPIDACVEMIIKLKEDNLL